MHEIENSYYFSMIFPYGDEIVFAAAKKNLFARLENNTFAKPNYFYN